MEGRARGAAILRTLTLATRPLIHETSLLAAAKAHLSQAVSGNTGVGWRGQAHIAE